MSRKLREGRKKGVPSVVAMATVDLVDLDDASATHSTVENTVMDVDEPPAVQESKIEDSPVGVSFDDSTPKHDKARC